MKHFAILDDPTFTFLLELKVKNHMWYMALVKCAKRSPRLALQCAQRAVANLPQAYLDISQINPFQICKAANAGLLECGIFDATHPSKTFEDYRNGIVKRLAKEMNFHKLT